MAERRVRFDVPENEKDDEEAKAEERPSKLKKHSLDSDEEDDGDSGEDENIMSKDDFDGVESGSMKFDGDIQITPFNLEEELETGHFDKDGNYIFQKESGDDQDNWLADIDWKKVKEKEDEQAGTSGNGQKGSDDDEDDSQDAAPEKETNIESLYKQMIELLQPGESIQKAIQRFGKNCPKVQRGNQNKKKAQQNNDAKDPAKLKAKEDLLKLSTLADDVLRTGDMDIYERTYEQINLELAKLTAKLAPKEVDAEDDMFGDDFNVNT